MGTKVKRNWLRLKVVLCLLSAPAFVGVGVYVAWEFTMAGRIGHGIDLLLSIFVLVGTVVMGVGMVVAAIDFAKVEY